MSERTDRSSHKGIVTNPLFWRFAWFAGMYGSNPLGGDTRLGCIHLISPPSICALSASKALSR